MNQMKILYYTHTYFIDCDLPLIKAFRELGHEVYFVFELVPRALKSTIINVEAMLPLTSIIPVSAYQDFFVFSEYLDMDKAFVLNRPGKIYGLSNIKLRYQFYKFVSSINPDIIHCTDFIDIADRFLYKYSKRIVQIVHDPFPHTGEGSHRRDINRRYAFKRLNKYVVLNEHQLSRFVAKNNLNPASVNINRLGVYECINMFSSGKDELNLQISTKSKVILFWGRISPYKGIEYLLKAMKMVHKILPDAYLVVAGAGSFDFDISQYERCSYIQFIHRYITMNELYMLLSHAALSVCPYTDATQSGVVMTSFAMGVPVVATNVGGLPEMVINGKSGIIVEPKSPQALADGIEKALAVENELRDNIASIYTDGELSWKSIASKYIEIYKG